MWLYIKTFWIRDKYFIFIRVWVVAGGGGALSACWFINLLLLKVLRNLPSELRTSYVLTLPSESTQVFTFIILLDCWIYLMQLLKDRYVQQALLLENLSFQTIFWWMSLAGFEWVLLLFWHIFKYLQNPNLMTIHEQQSHFWKSLESIQSTTALPSRCVVGLTVRDPRILLPKQRHKVETDPLKAGNEFYV